MQVDWREVNLRANLAGIGRLEEAGGKWLERTFSVWSELRDRERERERELERGRARERVRQDRLACGRLVFPLVEQLEWEFRLQTNSRPDNSIPTSISDCETRSGLV